MRAVRACCRAELVPFAAADTASNGTSSVLLFGCGFAALGDINHIDFRELAGLHAGSADND